MEMALDSSVGFLGRNLKDDVRRVQALLTKLGYKPGIPDGICGKRTQFAIETFQHTFLKVPDGRIDPGGLSWKKLTSGESNPQSTQMTKLLPKPGPGIVNIGLNAVSNEYMIKALGNPRKSYSEECEPIEDEKLKRNIIIESVGPFRVQGLLPAVRSLQEVMAEIRRAFPEVYSSLGTAGMLCCRYQRGSKTKISNHSWGTAVDLTINGVLDKRGDNKVQTGLSLIASTFNKFGWCWGATFPTEDAMHFEAGQDLIQTLAKALK